MADHAATAIVKLHDDMVGKRVNWESHWQEVTDHAIPRKNNIFRNSRTPGEKKTNLIYDSTAVHAVELLSSALHSMLTNPLAQWFELSVGIPEVDKIPEVRSWLQKAARKMIQIMNNSNFQTEIHEIYNDLSTLGTAVLRTEDDDEDHVRYHSRPINEHYVQENFKGDVDVVSRVLDMTGRQIDQQFNFKKISRKLDPMDAHKMLKLEEDMMKEWEVIHLVLPKVDAERMTKRKYRKPFVSFRVIKDLDIIISEKGFEEFPYAVSRWTKTSGEVLGRSPAMKSLPDIKMLNKMMRTTIRAAQKMVDPPMQMPDDGMSRPLRTIPGGVNYYRAGTSDRVEPLVTGGRPDIGHDMMEDTRKRIREAFFIDQLQLLEGPQMTATEVLQRTEEKLRLMGPVLGRQHKELLKPIIDRTFGILLRKEQLPANMPAELVDRNLEVKFSSMIARAQRATEADNIQRVISTIAPIAEAKPEVLDNINADNYLKFISDIFNVPQEIFNSEKDVEEMRAARQQQQEEVQQIENTKSQADTIATLGQAG